MVLPDKCAGTYWIRSKDISGKMRNILEVETVRSTEPDNDSAQWVLRSNRRYHIIGTNDQPVQSSVLQPLQLYCIESSDRRVRFVLYTEPLTHDRKSYSAYKLAKTEVTLTIGREMDNSIVYNNQFVSQPHARITFSPNGISIQDLGSLNFTYVNGVNVRQANLKNGDVVYIMGLQIVVTNQYVFINHPDGQVFVRSKSLIEHHLPAVDYSADTGEDDFDLEIAEEYYYRPPRFKHDVDTFELKIDAPPSDQNKDEMPLIMTIGPSMTMGMASIATGAYSVVSAMARGDITAAIPSIIMSISMLLGTLMWPLVTRTYQRRQRRKKEALRQSEYSAYLSEMEQVVMRETARQEQILRENDVDAATYLSKVILPNANIWERTHKHTDFLCLRLGNGRLPLNANIQCPERRFSLEKDVLAEALYQFGEQDRWLNGVPVCLKLTERFVSGVYANRNDLFTYAQSLILRIAALHGYDEVKLAVIYDESNSEEFEFVRWLPHTMNFERTVRYITTNSEEAKALSSALDPIIEYRKALGDNRLEDEFPYYVVICLDKDLTEKTECVRRLLEHKNNLKFSVLTMYERLEDLPKECSAVVRLNADSTGSLTLINEVSENPIDFRADEIGQIDRHKIAYVLANTKIDVSGTNFTLPSKYTFFEMLGIGMTEHLNLVDFWKNSDPTKSLSATIGVDKYGEPFKLDLHEHAHGPHGLVAGMTGSGKSEFIIAYILSMAIHYHPNEVAFILIDYKGGGMAKSFENLPHTAGVITNLDGNGIKRSLSSMKSELHRRERIFRDTSLKYNISNIDIYKYQKLYREGKVNKALPHLFIISDEFAELKKEQSEFMSELTSTARVGRSLGVHLILATQKPGGIVDDQIRSNSRFRICLKVQDNGDSMEMLGRPEAAALVDKGRFYLQVGNNELFEIGQSAWAGAPYYPSQRVIKDRDDAVSVINTNGAVIAEANIDRFAMFKDPPKQLDVVTEHIRKVSEEEGIRQWKMWLDPIPAQIYVDKLAEKYSETQVSKDRFVLNPIVGEYDDPSHQRQDIMRVPITENGNVIIYGSAGNGKEMFIESLCYSLMSTHSPEEVNLYILDFGAEMLTAFAQAPHVGDVILSYETEKVENLFKLMMGKLGTRKKKLSDFGGDLLQYNAQAEDSEANLVVIINNYAAFTELFEDKSAEINYLTREGVKYGIYFVLTCTGVNNVRFSLRQNFSTLYCLQLNSPDEYATVVGKTDGLFPEKLKGRGIFRPNGGDLYEFQTACITAEESPYQFIRVFAAAKQEEYPGKYAVRVPVLPEEVTEQFLAHDVVAGDISHVPVGVEKTTLELAYFNFAETPVSLILSSSQEWQGFADALGRLVSNRAKIDTMILAPGRKSSAGQNKKLRVFSSAQACLRAVMEIYQIVLTRNNTYKDALADGKPAPDFPPVFVMIQSMSQLKNVLEHFKSSTEKEADDDTPLYRLQLAMEKCESAYHVYFAVADSAGALTPFAVDGWYKTHINSNNGIWIGSGIASQFRLTLNKRPQEATAELGTDFGFLIRGATGTLVKWLQ